MAVDDVWMQGHGELILLVGEKEPGCGVPDELMCFQDVDFMLKYKVYHIASLQQ